MLKILGIKKKRRTSEGMMFQPSYNSFSRVWWLRNNKGQILFPIDTVYNNHVYLVKSNNNHI